MAFSNRNFRFSGPAAAAALVLLLLAVLLVRLSLREDFWLDEGSTIRRVGRPWGQLIIPAPAVLPEPIDPFDGRDLYDLNPPLYYVAVRLLAGPAPARLAVRLFSVVPMLLALLALAAWARSALGPRGGLAVILIGATAPGIIYYGHDARPYALPFAFAGLLLWLGVRWWRRPRRLFVACTLGAAAGCLCHFSFAWWVIAQWLVFAMIYLQARQDRQRADLANAAAQAAVTAAAGMLGLMSGALLAVLAILPQASLLRDCQAAPSAVLTAPVLMKTVGLPFSGVGQAPVPPALAFALQAATLALLAFLLRRSPRRQAGLLALALWLFPLAIPILMKYWFNTAFFERYAFFSLAGWLMMLAWIAQESAGRRGLPRALIALLLAALLVTNLAWGALNLHRPLREEWGRVIATLNRDSTPRDAYSLEPPFLRAVFAANARTPPPARYLDPQFGVPPEIKIHWIVLDTRAFPQGLAGIDPAVWTTQLTLRVHDLALYRLERR